VSDKEISFELQAGAVSLVARPECLKAIRCRDSETELLLTHLAAAVVTLRTLAAKRKAQKEAKDAET
jgi:hypothetical protein